MIRPPGTKRPRLPPGYELAIYMLVVAGLVFAAHAPALSARALAADDHQYLVDNPLVRNPSWSSVGQFLAEVLHPSTVGGYYQPLTMISLMIDTALGGSPTKLHVFHRTSLLLHVANSLLILLLLFVLFREPLAAAVISLLFGLHPMTVETIPWIGERKTLLASFFALCSTIAYVHHARKHSSGVGMGAENKKVAPLWQVLALVSYILALMSKPTSTALPAAFVLMDIWPLRQFSRRTLLEKAPFFAIGLISAVITYLSQAATFVQTSLDYGPSRLLVICHNIVFYPAKILWPTGLTSFYAYPEPFDLSNPVVLAGLVGTLLLIFMLIVAWRRGFPGPLVAWLIFMVMIFPTLGVVGFTMVIASDKYVYLPLMGPLILIGSALQQMLTLHRRRVTALILLIGSVIAAAEFLATRSYLRKWRNTETLYLHQLSLAPQIPTLHFGLAHEYQYQGRLDEAAAGYRRALELDPSHEGSHMNLAGMLLDQGRPAEALPHLDKVLEQNPNNLEARNNRGLALAAMGDQAGAIAEYERVLQSNPRHHLALTNLGRSRGEAGRLEEAVRLLEAALESRPDYIEARKNLAAAFWRMNRMDLALREYQELLRRNPDDADAHLLLARALVAGDQKARARTLLNEYLRRAGSHHEIEAELRRLEPPPGP